MLELKNLSVGYGKETILDDVTVSFEKGKLTSLIGVNGCGKSTLLKAVLGIIPIARGTVSADGTVLSSLKRTEIAKKISYLGQENGIPDMTVMQLVLHGRFPYLSYPRRYTSRDLEIARLAMEEVGIEALADKPLHTLSGGMRRIAYIAMSLAQNTDYILLDEPTTYLDIAHRLELMRILRRLADSGRGVLAVMHELPMAFDFSDEIALLHSKTSVMRGAPLQISGSPLIRSAFGVAIKYSEQENRYLYRYE